MFHVEYNFIMVDQLQAILTVLTFEGQRASESKSEVRVGGCAPSQQVGALTLSGVPAYFF